MADGDMAFFYHSIADPTGIVGTMRIVGNAYPDPTQFDPLSDYYDEKAPKDGSRWILRDVEFASKFKRVLTLSELRTIAGLEDMFVVRKGQRLSVMPVTKAEWDIVMGLSGI